MKTSGRVLPIVVALLTLRVALTLAQTPTPSGPSDKPAPPFAPSWAQFAGWEVFTQKDCGKCHAVRGVGGKVGPDLGRLQGGKSFFEVGAGLWNHLPKMGARMREMGIDRATLTPREAANLIAFLFAAQYGDESGNAAKGEKLFASKQCSTCHMIGGKGGRVGPELDKTRRALAPVSVAAAMWNHGPGMAEAMKTQGISRPALEDRELLDIITYLQDASTDTGESEQVIPGTPERGRALFTEKKCASCHAVGGRGPRVGPDLGTPGHHLSLTGFATRMWRHQPAMARQMEARKAEMPTLSGQDVADLLSYLYVSRYFEPAANADRGRAVAKEKGCLVCHSVRGQGSKRAADLVKSQNVRTPQALIAGMWNHSRLMERAAAGQGVEWPTLTGQELSDLSAYLGREARR
jgi:mono/diheme cytochrome c family protein